MPSAKYKNHHFHIQGMLPALLLFASVGIAEPSPAQVLRGQSWAASTASVDEGSIPKYEFVGTDAFVRSSLPTGHVLLRYNVVPTNELEMPATPGIECWQLGVDFLDNGSGARVQVNLYAQSVGGVESKKLIGTFDSNLFPPSTSFQKSFPGCNARTLPNFCFVSSCGGFVYYIDAYLTKSASGGTPGLRAIWVAIVGEQ